MSVLDFCNPPSNVFIPNTNTQIQIPVVARQLVGPGESPLTAVPTASVWLLPCKQCQLGQFQFSMPRTLY